MTTTHKQLLTEDAFQASHTKTAKAREALLPEALVPLNLDVNLAASTVMGLKSQLDQLRDQVAELPYIQISQYDKIQIYAEAVAQAQANFVLATAPAEPLPALAARAVELRDQLYADISVLARRKLVDPAALSGLKRGTGYLNAGADLGAMASMVRACWPDIQGQTGIKPEEIDEAQQLFQAIMKAAGERAHSAERIASVSDDRLRAWTLFVNAYDQGRRAITFLRWNDGDADKYAPSLYSGRNRGAAAQKPVDPPANGTTTPTTPVVVPADPTPTTPVTPTAQPATGMPGGAPFAHS